MSDSEPLAAAEVLLFARVLDEATRAGIRDAELLPVLDLICAIARSDAGTLELGGNGRPAVRCHVGDEDSDGEVFELRGDGGHLGRLVLMAPCHGWTDLERELLGVLTQVMAERFERSLAAESTRLAVVQLSAALESRVVLEQAKGMLAERHRTDVDVAFDRLRQSAREQRRTLREVAEEVVTHRAGLGRSR